MRAAGRWMASAERARRRVVAGLGPGPGPGAGRCSSTHLFARARGRRDAGGLRFPDRLPGRLRGRDGAARLHGRARRARPRRVAGALAVAADAGRDRAAPALLSGDGPAGRACAISSTGTGSPASRLWCGPASEPGPDGGAAGCMFWTLGAKQAGKAALSGWREVMVPARAARCAALAFRRRPRRAGRGRRADAGRVLPGRRLRTARLQVARQGRPRRGGPLWRGHLLAWTTSRRVALDAALRAAILGGFPPAAGGDDGFDAAVGLLAAIAVAAGERSAGPALTPAGRLWEGWILGRRTTPAAPES